MAPKKKLNPKSESKALSSNQGAEKGPISNSVDTNNSANSGNDNTSKVSAEGLSNIIEDKCPKCSKNVVTQYDFYFLCDDCVLPMHPECMDLGLSDDVLKALCSKKALGKIFYRCNSCILKTADIKNFTREKRERKTHNEISFDGTGNFPKNGWIPIMEINTKEKNCHDESLKWVKECYLNPKVVFVHDKMPAMNSNSKLINKQGIYEWMMTLENSNRKFDPLVFYAGRGDIEQRLYDEHKKQPTENWKIFMQTIYKGANSIAYNHGEQSDLKLEYKVRIVYIDEYLKTKAAKHKDASDPTKANNAKEISAKAKEFESQLLQNYDYILNDQHNNCPRINVAKAWIRLALEDAKRNRISKAESEDKKSNNAKLNPTSADFKTKNNDRDESTSTSGQQQQGTTSMIPSNTLEKRLERNETLDKKLVALGLKSHFIDGDGNCLFRAVSFSVHNDVNKHEELRANAVDDIRNNIPSYSKRFHRNLQETAELATEMSALNYATGNEALFALAQVLQCILIVYTAKSELQMYSPTSPLPDDLICFRQVHIAYYESEDPVIEIGHYKAVTALV